MENWDGDGDEDEDGDQNKEPVAVEGKCTALTQYANAKLALVVHAHEMNRQFYRQERSYVINPGAVDSEIGRSTSSPTKPSMRSRIMHYFPPVWIAKQLYALIATPISRGMLRAPSYAAKAQFHVLTSPTLALGFGEGSEEGGLFADTMGPFRQCGKEGAAGECGRVPLHMQPAVAVDRTLAGELWIETKRVLKPYLSPLN
jgi:hypothetical protein